MPKASAGGVDHGRRSARRGQFSQRSKLASRMRPGQRISSGPAVHQVATRPDIELQPILSVSARKCLRNRGAFRWQGMAARRGRDAGPWTAARRAAQRNPTPHRGARRPPLALSPTAGGGRTSIATRPAAERVNLVAIRDHRHECLAPRGCGLDSRAGGSRQNQFSAWCRTLSDRWPRGKPRSS
ncbi:MAG: hypothetical protein RL701_133 [Pseudomonadota bacterium]